MLFLVRRTTAGRSFEIHKRDDAENDGDGVHKRQKT
jgi:hypothetical protein